MVDLVTSAEIADAFAGIRDVVRTTPVLPCSALPSRTPLLLKAEHTQLLGSFKIRGALHAVKAAGKRARRAGVVAFSSGNHGKAVAYAAKALGVAATIVMPVTAPAVKVEAVRALGATVHLVEPEKRETHPKELGERTGAVVIHPFDSREVIAGHGSIGLELLDQVPGLGTVLVPVSGGGLISGVAAAVKARRPGVRVIGVEPELAADAAESHRLGRLVAWPEEDTGRTMADGLRADRLGELPWDHIRMLVDEIVTVSEEEIADTLRQLAMAAKQLVEPSGAVAAAAMVHRRAALPAGGATVAILSGGNVAPGLAARVLAGGPDRPAEPARPAASRGVATS
ncbi:threonine ammonia-lyase [Amycolatopsis pigmentata]|uniref:Threonine/serine dehydratase n=1 Tax=Amycolatopsis pigmentata TaxID=450801 RepID=A0ABW5FQC4_9PSEU